MEPSDGYIQFIVNPKSGACSSDRRVYRFSNYLQDKGYSVEMCVTRSLGHACELATEAAVDFDCCLVVGAGGDGTIREVAHGLEGSDKPLLIVPEGTENLLASELGYDERFSTLINTFENPHIKALDLGSINGKCFTSIAGFGFDGDVVKRVCERRKGHITYMDYFWPVWRTFSDYKFCPMKVEVDGVEIFSGPGLVFVGNITRYAIGLQILPKANYSDGLLDVCIYKCSSKRKLVHMSLLTVLKRHINSRDVIYLQGKNIRVTDIDKPINTEIDGDPGPGLPVEVKVIPHAINVMVGPDAKPAGMRTRLKRAIG